MAEKRHKGTAEDVDIYKLASEMVIDSIIEPDTLRDELIARFDSYKTKTPLFWGQKKCPVLHCLQCTAAIF